ncbi:MAG: hypothetical protein V4472_22335 [Pseudomonadota bacterium]
MIVTRRQAVIGLAAASTAAAGPAFAWKPGADRPALAIHDSRIPESIAFARNMKGIPLIDLAREHASGWQAARALAVERGTVAGLTGWSDWVAVRGLLLERGLRVLSEAAVAAPLSGAVHLFRWDMGRR